MEKCPKSIMGIGKCNTLGHRCAVLENDSDEIENRENLSPQELIERLPTETLRNLWENAVRKSGALKGCILADSYVVWMGEELDKREKK